jgi:hypothetical protein
VVETELLPTRSLVVLVIVAPPWSPLRMVVVYVVVDLGVLAVRLFG